MEWIEYSDHKPKQDGKYIVASTYGIVIAYFSTSRRGCFQDVGTNNDEGMKDWDGRVFAVTHWMHLPQMPS